MTSELAPSQPVAGMREVGPLRVGVEEGPKGARCAGSTSSLELPHPTAGEADCVGGSDRLAFGPQRVHAVARVLGEQLLPGLDLAEPKEDLFPGAQLLASGVEPHETLLGFRADHHHVVVRGDDDLVRLSGEGYDVFVGALPCGGSVVFVADVSGTEAEDSQGLRDPGAEQLVP